MLPRPEQASLILTEVDLPVAARLTLAEETFRGESCSIDYKALSRNIELDPISSGSSREREREREGRGREGGGKKNTSCTDRPTDRPTSDFNQLFASATAREFAGRVGYHSGALVYGYKCGLGETS